MNNQINPGILYDERFPLSNQYDPAWIFDNAMGPNPLWLTEFLAQALDLKPGMRVLDLGCGRGMTSVFLAREFGARVFAVDLWEDPEKKWENARAFGVKHLVAPIQADARSLPFAQGFFDAVVCVDAYMYFGQEEGYLENLLRFLHPGGRLGMIMPGYVKAVVGDVPAHIKTFLGDELWTWKPLPWWKSLWEKTGLVSVNVADTMPNGCDLWLRWDTALLEIGKGRWGDETDIFKADRGEYIGIIRLAATKK